MPSVQTNANVAAGVAVLQRIQSRGGAGASVAGPGASSVIRDTPAGGRGAETIVRGGADGSSLGQRVDIRA